MRLFLSFVSSHYLPPEEDLDDLDSLDLEEDELLLRDELLLPWFEERVVVALVVEDELLLRVALASLLRLVERVVVLLAAGAGVELLSRVVLRVEELAFPLVADELRVVEEKPLVVWFVVLADLETPLLRGLLFTGAYALTDRSLTVVLPERSFTSNLRTSTLLPVVVRYSLTVGPL